MVVLLKVRWSFVVCMLSLVTLMLFCLLLQRTLAGRIDISDIHVSVVSSPETLDRIFAQHNTWANPAQSQLTVHYYVGNGFDVEEALRTRHDGMQHPFLDHTRHQIEAPPTASVIQLNDVAEMKSHFITRKTLKMWEHVYQTHILHNTSALLSPVAKTFGWFLKCDDDAYVVTENLIQYLANIKEDPMVTPMFLGRIVQPGDTVAHRMVSGGAGYIFSYALLKQFGAVMQDCAQSSVEDVESWGEDVVITKCLQRLLHVLPTDVPSLHTNVPRNIDQWKGWDRMPDITFSENPITFHYVRPVEMYELDYLLRVSRPRS